MATADRRRRRTCGWPLGVDVAPNGDVFIVDYQARKMRKVRASDGVIATIAGDGTIPPTTCQTNWPCVQRGR